MPPPPMKRELSVYIDLLRFLAALAVLGEHGSDYVGGWIWRFANFGGDAVGVFFVLSGLVIAHVTGAKEHSPASYFRARAIRMYSVVIPAIAITLILDAWGARYAPDVYATALRVNAGPLDYLRSLTFTHQLWYNETHIGSMGPFWSLGFEVPYYLLFGSIIFLGAWPWLRRLSVIGWLAFYGPRIAAYFPLWYLGTFCQRFLAKADDNNSRNAGTMWAWLGVLLAPPLWYAWHQLNYSDITFRLKISNGPSVIRPLIYYYGLGILLCVHLYSFARIAHRFTLLTQRLGDAIRWLAGGTFTLYLLNLPVLIFFKSLLIAIPPSNLKTTGILAATLLVCFVVAELIERRNSPFRLLLVRLLK
jgi:peptidoglycan/LPS O-acetylase OafA/YrhL